MAALAFHPSPHDAVDAHTHAAIRTLFSAEEEARFVCECFADQRGPQRRAAEARLQTFLARAGYRDLTPRVFALMRSYVANAELSVRAGDVPCVKRRATWSSGLPSQRSLVSPQETAAQFVDMVRSRTPSTHAHRRADAPPPAPAVVETKGAPVAPQLAAPSRPVSMAHKRNSSDGSAGMACDSALGSSVGSQSSLLSAGSPLSTPAEADDVDVGVPARFVGKAASTTHLAALAESLDQLPPPSLSSSGQSAPSLSALRQSAHGGKPKPAVAPKPHSHHGRSLSNPLPPPPPGLFLPPPPPPAACDDGLDDLPPPVFEERDTPKAPPQSKVVLRTALASAGKTDTLRRMLTNRRKSVIEHDEDDD